MTVKKRDLDKGRLTNHYYYRFKINGKEYKGSTYHVNKKEAQEFEDNLKAELRGLLKEGNGSELVRRKNLVHFREKITVEVQGESILLDEIWPTFKEKAPAKMRQVPSERIWKGKQGRWDDFLAFLKTKYPDCITMRQVTMVIAEDYISLIKTSGRFQKTIINGKVSYESKTVKLSPSTINKYINDISQVFRILSSEAGLLENPFRNVKAAKIKTEKRNVFELNELEKIEGYLQACKKGSLSKSEMLNFIVNEAIFIIGVNSGLRKGDICQLKWNDVDFHKKAIDTIARKTGEKVFIPLTETLYKFLNEKHQNKVGEYVTPELAEMYLSNKDGVIYRFKKMLKALHIESLKTHDERSRKVSSKDIHSLRHTFCYLHGIQGTPMIVVQSMMGHLNKKMTEAYMMHQTEELKRNAIEKFSLKPFIGLLTSSDTKKKLIALIQDCQSEDMLKKFYTHLENEIATEQMGHPHGTLSHRVS